VLFQGNRIVTSNEAADALLEYARALSSYGLHDTVQLPVVLDGAVASCTILIEPGVAWATVSLPGVATNSLAGSSEAAQALRDRMTRLLEGSISHQG
jgi:hypothetical protein